MYTLSIFFSFLLPIKISLGKNKRKGRKLTRKMEQILMTPRYNFVSRSPDTRTQAHLTSLPPLLNQSIERTKCQSVLNIDEHFSQLLQSAPRIPLLDNDNSCDQNFSVRRRAYQDPGLNWQLTPRRYVIDDSVSDMSIRNSNILLNNIFVDKYGSPTESC